MAGSSYGPGLDRGRQGVVGGSERSAEQIGAKLGPSGRMGQDGIGGGRESS